MKPVSPVIPGLDLPETIFAKDQKEYVPLPAIVADGGTRVITRWKMTWRERLGVFLGGDVWLSVLTFGNPLQPVLLETESPIRYLTITEDPAA